jgi:hypothetical protein
MDPVNKLSTGKLQSLESHIESMLLFLEAVCTGLLINSTRYIQKQVGTAWREQTCDRLRQRELLQIASQ